MPIYEYECTGCGQIEEVFQKFSDKPLTRCKHCSGRLHKLISQSSFHLKGTGWYVTDYAHKSGPDSSPSKKADKAEATGKPPSSSPKKKSKTTTGQSGP